jgi:predicted phosphodiesterase
MRIAAVSDIHGNLSALEAVLEDIARRGADAIVNLGDIVSGPLRPRATAERLMALDLPTIGGNHERQLLALSPVEVPAGSISGDQYAAAEITPAQRAWLAALPATRWLGDEVFLCHATPMSDVDCYLENIRAGELIPASLAQIDERSASCAASLILCGHTHIPRVARTSTGQLIVNPGSVGSQAYRGHHPVPHVLEMGSPHARYAILERSRAGWTTELRAIPYDWDHEARLAATHGRPDYAHALRTGFLGGGL